MPLLDEVGRAALEEGHDGEPHHQHEDLTRLALGLYGEGGGPDRVRGRERGRNGGLPGGLHSTGSRVQASVNTAVRGHDATQHDMRPHTIHKTTHTHTHTHQSSSLTL